MSREMMGKEREYGVKQWSKGNEAYGVVQK